MSSDKPQQQSYAQPQPPPKSHKMRNIVLGVLGAIVLIVIIVKAAGGGTTPSTASSSISQPPAAAAADNSAAPPASPTSAAPPTPAAPRPTSPPPAAAAPASFVMPNEVGSNLQAAQDDIQRVSGNPIYITSSHDATGLGRHQILDRDWQVCSQDPAPGTQVQGGVPGITFNVVKLYETCP